MASKIVATATVRAVKHRKLLPMRAALSLTPAAVNRIKQLLEGKNEFIGLKEQSKQHRPHFDKMDEEVVQDGVKVLIDKKAQLSLLGTEMDYVETDLSAEFVFNNPNIKGTCGCGESFSI